MSMPKGTQRSFNPYQPTQPYPAAAPHHHHNSSRTHSMASALNAVGPRPVGPDPNAGAAATMSPGGDRPSAAWTTEDDTRLMQCRTKGMNWGAIASHFPGKTPNACRKRHERLMERRNAESWDGARVEDLARAYLESREQMWKLVADRVGEKWQTVEAKCMEKGLKTLQNMGRPRRSGLRPESPTSHQSGEAADDPFFVDAEHASHAASLGFAPPGLPPSSFAPHYPSAYASRSRQASVAPPPPGGMLPGSAPTSMATGGGHHRYSLSNSSSYGPTAGPVPTSAGGSGYGGLGFSPTAAYTSQGLPAPPLPSFSRPYEPGAPSAGPSLPSLHSFLQSPREPMSATSY